MDKAADTKVLEDRKAVLVAWRDHPFTKELFQANAEAQESAIALLCNCDITNVETFFAHFAAIGHLRGLRQLTQAYRGALEEIDNEIKDL
jgi:hypothetical protein